MKHFSSWTFNLKLKVHTTTQLVDGWCSFCWLIDFLSLSHSLRLVTCTSYCYFDNSILHTTKSKKRLINLFFYHFLDNTKIHKSHHYTDYTRWEYFWFSLAFVFWRLSSCRTARRFDFDKSIFFIVLSFFISLFFLIKTKKKNNK